MGKGRTMREAHAIGARLPLLSRIGEVVSLDGRPWIARVLRHNQQGGICAAGFVHGGSRPITARSGWLETHAWLPSYTPPYIVPGDGCLVLERTTVDVGRERFDSALVRDMMPPGSSWALGNQVEMLTTRGRVHGYCRPLQITACNWRAVVMPLATEEDDRGR